MASTAAPVDRALEILDHRHLGASHHLLTLSIEERFPAWAPGQFVMITLGQPSGSVDPLLRRPFSILNTPESNPGALQILYKALGRGTRILSGASGPTSLRVLGPLGHGFDPPRPAGARLALVAGGIGSASLHPLALHELAMGRSPLMLYGCRTQAELAGLRPSLEAGVECRIATDDGTEGRRGFASDLLEDLLREAGSRAADRWVVCACGPMAMMKATAAVAARHSVPCFVSLESPMACGFGVCVGCVVGTRETPDAPLRYRRICVEGPVFDAARVCW